MSQKRKEKSVIFSKICSNCECLGCGIKGQEMLSGKQPVDLGYTSSFNKLYLKSGSIISL